MNRLGGASRWLRRREFHVAAVLLLTVAVVGTVNPGFLAPGNVRDMLVNCAPTAIIACGVTLVMLTGEIDISVGSLMGLLAATVGLLTSVRHGGLPVYAGVGLTLLLAAGVGLANGLLVTVTRIPSIIVTLAMLTALRGATTLLMGGEWVTDLPPDLRFLGTGQVLGLPVSIWMVIAVVAFSVVLARRTPLGRRIYAVGSNPRSAETVGLSPRRVRLFVFAATGLLTGVATLVSAPRLSVIEAGTGRGLELLVVTCVVVGGTSISGGRGTILGSMLGVVLMGIIGTVLIYLRLGETATYWERAVQGTFILLAVLADHLARRRRAAEEAAS